MNVKTLMQAHSLTAYRTARLLGVHRSTVGRWMTGQVQEPKWAAELLAFKLAQMEAAQSC